MRYFVYYWDEEYPDDNGSSHFEDRQEAIEFAERLRNEAGLICEIYLGELI
jgi:hypothetical protein